jgi:hypothetical protein
LSLLPNSRNRPYLAVAARSGEGQAFAGHRE